METLKKTALFWDVADIDPKKNEKFVIERILAFGNEDDFHWAKKFYGDEIIKKNILKSKTLDTRSLYFWCKHFNIDQNLCIRKQLTKKPSAFWRR